MKRTLLVFSLLALSLNFINAQRSIILQNGSKVVESGKIASIIAQAEAGDTIYLPGGNIVLTSEWQIDKELHIIGVGHYPDSTRATSYTNVSGADIRFMQGADNSSITGFYFHNYIHFGIAETDSIINISISRCNLSQIALGINIYTRNVKHTRITFNENVLRGAVWGGDAQYVYFNKNIFNSTCQNFNDNAVFYNNIFLTSYARGVFNTYYPSSGVELYNNIFARAGHGLSASEIYNNLWTFNLTVTNGTNSGNGNIVNNHVDSLFVEYDNGTAFNYDHNYHLHEKCDGIGAGKDGNDIGIYGSSTPYKEGAVPFNPHVRTINIASETENGLLPVEITVGAQDR